MKSLIVGIKSTTTSVKGKSHRKSKTGNALKYFKKLKRPYMGSSSVWREANVYAGKSKIIHVAIANEDRRKYYSLATEEQF